MLVMYILVRYSMYLETASVSGASQMTSNAKRSHTSKKSRKGNPKVDLRNLPTADSLFLYSVLVVWQQKKKKKKR